MNVQATLRILSPTSTTIQRIYIISNIQPKTQTDNKTRSRSTKGITSYQIDKISHVYVSTRKQKTLNPSLIKTKPSSFHHTNSLKTAVNLTLEQQGLLN